MNIYCSTQEYFYTRQPTMAVKALLAEYQPRTISKIQIAKIDDEIDLSKIPHLDKDLPHSHRPNIPHRVIAYELQESGEFYIILNQYWTK